jgi:hypothetical protein
LLTAGLALALAGACRHSRSRSQPGYDVTGQVLATTGEPLTGATITSLDGSLSTQTDAAGRFLLSGLPLNQRAVLIDARTASPGGTFQMRMNLPEPVKGLVALERPMHVPVCPSPTARNAWTRRQAVTAGRLPSYETPLCSRTKFEGAKHHVFDLRLGSERS